jgi:hypothetical protein
MSAWLSGEALAAWRVANPEASAYWTDARLDEARSTERAFLASLGLKTVKPHALVAHEASDSVAPVQGSFPYEQPYTS